MAQHSEDWSGSTVGNAPTGWTLWTAASTASPIVQVESDPLAPAGRRLRFPSGGADGRRLAIFDAVANATQYTMRALVRVTAPSAPVNTVVASLAVRILGTSTADMTARTVGFNRTSGARSIRWWSYVSGTGSSIATTAFTGGTYEYDTVYLMEVVTTTGNTLTFKLFAGSDDPLTATPLFTASGTNSQAASAGKPGVYCALGSTDVDWLWVGVGTGGDDAPALPEPSGATEMDAEPGALVVTGADAALAHHRVIDAQDGAFTVTGAAAALTRTHILNAEPGAMVLTGAAATLARGLGINAGPGAYVLTGAPAADYLRALAIDAAPGSYSVTGSAATLARRKRLVGEPGSYAITGAAATATHGYIMLADPGVYTITGRPATGLEGEAPVDLVGGALAGALASPLMLPVWSTVAAKLTEIMGLSGGAAQSSPNWLVGPAIEGVPNAGQVLTVTQGLVSGHPPPSRSYQWFRLEEAIDGATERTWVATEGGVVTCIVTATSAAGIESIETEPFGPIGPALAAPAWSVAPSISGTKEAGQTLTCAPGTITGHPTPSVAYQWKRAGVAIAGATASTWVATAGSVVTCTVTATNSQGVASATAAEYGPIETAVPAVRLWASGFEDGVTISGAQTGTGNSDQYVRGGDVSPWLADPPNLWSTAQSQRFYILSVTGNGLPSGVTRDYIQNSIKGVTSRGGTHSRALSLHIKQDSPLTSVEQTKLQQVGSAEEAVYYQRMWVKFSEDTLARAIAATSTHFFQIFWEVKANPDYRIRCELRFNGTDLVWFTQADILTNAVPLWSATLDTVPVVLAPHDSRLGWHQVEIYLNRPAAIYRVAIDGEELINRTTGTLYGATGSRLDENKHLMFYSLLPGPVVTGEILCDDIEIYDKPPAGAWAPGYSLGADIVATALADFNHDGTEVGDTLVLAPGQFAFKSSVPFVAGTLYEITYSGTGTVIYRQAPGVDYDGPTALPITIRVDGDGLSRVQVEPSGGSATLTAVTAKPISFDFMVATADSAPVWTDTPVIEGEKQEGQTLTLTAGTLTGYPVATRTYQWTRGGVAIEGATSSTWVATPGAAVRCEVTATNYAGTATATTEPFGPIVASTVIWQEQFNLEVLGGEDDFDATTVRVIVPPSSLRDGFYNEVRFTLAAAPTGNSTYIEKAYAYAADETGTAYAFDNVPVPVTFDDGAATAKTIAAGATVTTDPVVFFSDGSRGIVLAVYFAAGSGATSTRVATMVDSPAVLAAHVKDLDDAKTVAPTGYTFGGDLLLKSLELRDNVVYDAEIQTLPFSDVLWDTTGTKNADGTVTLANLQYLWRSIPFEDGFMYEVLISGTGNVYLRWAVGDYLDPQPLPIHVRTWGLDTDGIDKGRIQFSASGAATITGVSVRPIQTAPVWKVDPVISGVALVGETLTCSAGTVAGNPAPTVAYQWMRDDAPIEGETTNTWIATGGGAVTCRVTATNDLGASAVFTAEFGPIPFAPVWVSAPSIAGTLMAGETLSLTGGDYHADPAPTFTYQWKRGGAAIEGATGATWVATAGLEVLCTITATNAHGAASIDTAAVGPIMSLGADLLWATNFEAGLTITSQGTSVNNTDQYLRGGDVSPWLTAPPLLWSTPFATAWYILSIVGNGGTVPTTNYIFNSIREVTGPDGATTRALSHNIRGNSPKTGVEQVPMQNAYATEEAVFYQRSWVKFPPETLTRAIAATSVHFYLIFWEIKANPDFRIRVELRYDGTKLYWWSQADILSNAVPIWQRTLTTVPVVLAAADSPLGWHNLELWIDRFGGEFKVAIDGVVFVDITGASETLLGAQQTVMDEIKHMFLYSLNPNPVAGEILFDRLELWDEPPEDAWDARYHDTGANVAPALSAYTPGGVETNGTVVGSTIELDAGEFATTSNFTAAGAGFYEIRYEGTGSVQTREDAGAYAAAAALPITKYKQGTSITRVQAVASGAATLTAITVKPVTWD